ncbi:MAG: DNA translocase FtsK 4TM domain-containing protein [Phycisphaerales bacterium JB050]
MASKSKTSRARYESDEPSSMARLIWLVALFVWLGLAAAFLSYSPADPPGTAIATGETGQIANWIGVVGAFIAHHGYLMLGIGVWVILASAGAYLAILAWRGPVSHPVIRGIGVVIGAVAISSGHALLLPELAITAEGGGGLLGIIAAHHLQLYAGTVGAAGLLCLFFILGAWIAVDRLLVVVPHAAATVLGTMYAKSADTALDLKEKAAARRETMRANDIDDDKRLRAVETFLGAAKRRKQREAAKAKIDERAGGIGGAGNLDEDLDELDDVSSEVEPKPAKPKRKGKTRKAPEPVEAEDEYDEVEDNDEEYEDDDTPGAPQVFTEDQLRDKIAKLPVRFASTTKNKATQEDLDALREQRKSEEEADRNYNFPTLELLADPEENFSEELEKWVREQAEALERALQTYKIEGEVVGIDSGPVITLYRVRLAPGTKVSQLGPIASDIARMLKAVNIRIVPNEEGQDTVGIEVPNRKKEKVRLKELMTNSQSAAKMKLPLFLGKDASGNPLIIDLASLPHMLIAGTTGSGKSVCMNAILMGFLYTQKPSDLKLVLVDPKMVELSQFKDIPHLMCPVVTEMSKAAAILEWAVTKMDERYELLAEAGCRDIASYNNLGWDELKERFNPQTELEEAKIPRKLPYMVFVIDELADLMMTNKEVEGAIVRIAQKARAVGIHLILATQRPQANVVTGLIKSNMPGRVSFRVASGMDSRIVLDQKGGELLLGHGDMLMLTPRSSVPIRAQGTLVDDIEIRRVVRFVKDVSGPTFERALTTIGESGYGSAGTGLTAEEYEERMRKSAQEDPIFDRAVEIVLETKRGSVSLLQRRLAIGYTRASRLIELMGQAGIIGEHKGSVAREVLMSLDEWEAMKEFAKAEEGAVYQGDESDKPSEQQLEDETLFPVEETAEERAAREAEEADARDAAADEAMSSGMGGSERQPAETPPFEADQPVAADEETEDEESEDLDEDEEDWDGEDDDDSDEDEDDGDDEDSDEETGEEEDSGEDEEDEEDEEEDDVEYVYVDEDGNEIPADELDDEEYEYSDDEEEDEEDEPESPKLSTKTGA